MNYHVDRLRPKIPFTFSYIYNPPELCLYESVKQKNVLYVEPCSIVKFKNNTNIISGRNLMDYTRLRPLILLLHHFLFLKPHLLCYVVLPIPFLSPYNFQQ